MSATSKSRALMPGGIDKTRWDAVALRAYYVLLDQYRAYGTREQRENAEQLAAEAAQRGFEERSERKECEPWETRSTN